MQTPEVAGEFRSTTVLVVDDERALRASLRRLLTAEGFQVLEAADGREAMALVARSAGRSPPAGVAPHPEPVPAIDIVISDLRMPEADGMALLRFVREQVPALEVIVLTGFGEVADAVAALKLGACNFLEKPFDPPAFLLEVKRAQLVTLQRRHLRTTPPSAAPQGPPRLLGESAPMRDLRALVGRIAATDAAALILGESGTGKELVARAIHDSSRRRRGPFVAVHCGAIPEPLFESELFGHVKGAFTGATANRDGRFALAEGGTIFLDEIGEMPLSMQVKLLRVLQERSYEPVGTGKARHGDFRVLAATNRDLVRAVAQGTFRQDLFYRLEVVPVVVPALRERPDDIALLCEAFVADHARAAGTPFAVPDAGALEAMRRYPWPGNVRELEHLVERLSVLKDGGPITLLDLPALMREGARPSPGAAGPAGAPRSLDLNAQLQQLEIELIRRALRQSGGNKNRASQLLGINRTTLVEKIKRLGLHPPAGEPSDGAADLHPSE